MKNIKQKQFLDFKDDSEISLLSIFPPIPKIQ